MQDYHVSLCKLLLHASARWCRQDWAHLSLAYMREHWLRHSSSVLHGKNATVVSITLWLLTIQEWTALAKMVFRMKPLQRNNPPKSRIRLACYKGIQTKVSPAAPQLREPSRTCASSRQPVLVYCVSSVFVAAKHLVMQMAQADLLKCRHRNSIAQNPCLAVTSVSGFGIFGKPFRPMFMSVVVIMPNHNQ